MVGIDAMSRQPVIEAIGWALLHFAGRARWWELLTAAVLGDSSPERCRRALRGIDRRARADADHAGRHHHPDAGVERPGVVQAGSSGEGAHWQGLKTLRYGISNRAPAGMDRPLQRRVSRPARIALGLGTSNVHASRPASWSIEEWLPMLLGVWLAGVAILTLRLFSGWMWVQRMKSHDAQPVHEGLEAMGRRLMRRLHIVRAVRFLESRIVDVPTVIGWLRPVVLLPVSTLAGLTPRQVEAILAHELAHIRRHDYLVNLLQTVVETLLFYHPAVWWLSHRIRVERENCCDDLAVSLCGDPVAYAAALAELEGLRASSGELAMAVSGGSLLQRIKRVLGAPSHAGRAPGWLAAGVALLVVARLVGQRLSNTDAQRDRSARHHRGRAPQSMPSPPHRRPAHLRLLRRSLCRHRLTPRLRPLPRRRPASPWPSCRRSQRLRSSPQVAAARAVEAVIAPVPPAASTHEALAAAYGHDRDDGAGNRGCSRWPRLHGCAGCGQHQGLHRANRQHARRIERNYVWSDNGQKIEINYRGEIDFTADDTEVARMSPGAMLRIRDGRRWLGADTSAEFTADGSGNITRKFWQGWKEQPFEPEGRKWLATMLPRFIRQSGFGASARVARIHKSAGVTGVLAEISRIDGSWAKHLYFKELMKTPGLSAADVQRVFNRAGPKSTPTSSWRRSSFRAAGKSRMTPPVVPTSTRRNRSAPTSSCGACCLRSCRVAWSHRRSLRTPGNQHVHRFRFRRGFTPRAVRPPAAD